MGDRSTIDVLAKLGDARYLDDPYPLYAELRGRRVVRTPRGGIVLARHSDVTAVLSDARFGKLRVPRMPLTATRVLFRMFLLLDPPDHTRLRRVVAPLFSQSSISAMRASVEATAARLLPQHATIVDLVADFAYPLPFAVVSDLLGVPHDDRAQLARWSRVLTESLDTPPPTRARDVPRALAALARRKSHPIAAARAGTAMVRYAQQHLALATAAPPTAFCDALLRAIADGEIDDDEAAATWIMMAIAGHETTANFIGNAVLALVEHPDVVERVIADPSLVPRAVEECLRYDTPVPHTLRVAHKHTHISGATVEPGETTLLLLAAANRDPDAFPDPDRLDLTRPKTPPHLGFAHGIHFCLGAALARLEAEAALGVVLPRLALGPERPAIKRRPNIAVRGLAAFPLAIRPAPAPAA